MEDGSNCIGFLQNCFLKNLWASVLKKASFQVIIVTQVGVS